MLWRGACSVLEGCGIFGVCFQCYGGVWHFWGVTFRKRRLQSFGGVWHFWRALAVLWRGACSVLEECGIFGVCFQCYGGVWHFGECFGV